MRDDLDPVSPLFVLHISRLTHFPLRPPRVLPLNESTNLLVSNKTVSSRGTRTLIPLRALRFISGHWTSNTAARPRFLIGLNFVIFSILVPTPLHPAQIRCQFAFVLFYMILFPFRM